jgi:hypothetical protein
MRPTLLTVPLLCLWAAAAQAAGPSAATLSTLNQHLNPTPTPNLYGIESHLNGAGDDLDQQGNHLFLKTQTPNPKGGAARAPSARTTPTAAFLPLWKDMRDFEKGLTEAEKSGDISKARAQSLRQRLALLKIKYRLDQAPDGSRLSGGQMKRLRAELNALKS